MPIRISIAALVAVTLFGALLQAASVPGPIAAECQADPMSDLAPVACGTRLPLAKSPLAGLH